VRLAADEMSSPVPTHTSLGDVDFIETQWTNAGLSARASMLIRFFFPLLNYTYFFFVNAHVAWLFSITNISWI
jgi:hypothetical protein